MHFGWFQGPGRGRNDKVKRSSDRPYVSEYKWFSMECRVPGGVWGRCRKTWGQFGLEKGVSSTKEPFHGRKTPSTVGNVAQSFCTSCRNLHYATKVGDTKRALNTLFRVPPRPVAIRK